MIVSGIPKLLTLPIDGMFLLLFLISKGGMDKLITPQVRQMELLMRMVKMLLVMLLELIGSQKNLVLLLQK